MSAEIQYHLARDEQYVWFDGPKALTREAWSRALVKIAKEHPEIVVLSADLMKATRADIFAEAFPERAFNVGVAEQDMLGIAAGLALCGKVPFVASFSVFALYRACEQVRTDVCYPKLNVKIVGIAGGLSFGMGGVTHATTEDISVARTWPNLVVLVPADAAETEKAVYAAVERQGPVFLRVGRAAEPVVYPEGCNEFEIGKAVTMRDGSDVTLIACGVQVFESLRAAETLATHGIHARVINMHTVKPLDREAVLSAARETGAILSVEENTIVGGLGSAVAEVLAEARLAVPFLRIGMRDAFAVEGNPDYLRPLYGLDGPHIAAAAEDLVRSAG